MLKYPQFHISYVACLGRQIHSMLIPRNAFHFSFSALLALPLAAVFAVNTPAQETNSNLAQAETGEQVVPNVLPVQEDLTDPNNLRPLTQADSILSLQGGQRLMTEASQAIDGQDYALARQKLQEARQVFNQLSNFHQQLSGSFSGIDNRISESLRQNALETAQMRDQATYQLSLVHRAQNEPELAVPLLIQIVRSQSPTTDLGKKAYQQLFELGFVDSPYPRPRNSQNSQSNTTPGAVGG